jgi:hypothetical protein
LRWGLLAIWDCRTKVVDHQSYVVVELGRLVLTAQGKVVGGGGALLDIELLGVFVVGIRLFQFVLRMGANVLSISLLGKALLS